MMMRKSYLCRVCAVNVCRTPTQLCRGKHSYWHCQFAVAKMTPFCCDQGSREILLHFKSAQWEPLGGKTSFSAIEACILSLGYDWGSTRTFDGHVRLLHCSMMTKESCLKKYLHGIMSHKELELSPSSSKRPKIPQLPPLWWWMSLMGGKHCAGWRMHLFKRNVQRHWFPHFPVGCHIYTGTMASR